MSEKASYLSSLAQNKVSYFSWTYKKDEEDTTQEVPIVLVLEMSPKYGKNFNLVKSEETLCVLHEEALKKSHNYMRQPELACR